MKVGAVLLAAGGGRRFVGPTHKLLAPFGGTSVVGAALAAMVGSGVVPRAVVTGAAAFEVPGGVTVLVNPTWAEGQASSLSVALAWADAAGLDALVVGLGDQPGVAAGDWRAVATAAGGPIVTASFSGKRRPPVRLGRAVWPLLPVDGDEGARALMRARPDLVVEVPAEGDPTDIDTADDLES